MHSPRGEEPTLETQEIEMHEYLDRNTANILDLMDHKPAGIPTILAAEVKEEASCEPRSLLHEEIEELRERLFKEDSKCEEWFPSGVALGKGKGTLAAGAGNDSIPAADLQIIKKKKKAVHKAVVGSVPIFDSSPTSTRS